MSKKYFVPARLVEGYRWYIHYYQVHPITDERVLFRETYGLNRIKDLRVRARQARMIVKDINRRLPQGYPYENLISEQGIPILDALEIALNEKLRSPRKNTQRTYSSVAREFEKWLRKKKYNRFKLGEFTKKYARDYANYLAIRPKAVGQGYISNRTFNTYLTHMKGLFSVLVEEEHILVNPFSKLKTKPVGDKMRRALEDDERKVIASYMKEHYPWMFYAILIQYYCFIRPGEMRRLHFRDFDLKRGLITVRANDAKTWKKRVVTIPSAVLHYFRDPFFSSWPNNYYVFGIGMKPHSTKQVSPNRMNKRHKAVIVKLHKAGTLRDITGIQWYSWKDTGIRDHSDSVSLIKLRDQAGHESTDQTLQYYKPHEINQEMKQLPFDLL